MVKHHLRIMILGAISYCFKLYISVAWYYIESGWMETYLYCLTGSTKPYLQFYDNVYRGVISCAYLSILSGECVFEKFNNEK